MLTLDLPVVMSPGTKSSTSMRLFLCLGGDDDVGDGITHALFKFSHGA